MEYSEFRNKVLKATNKKHNFKVTNSNGNKEAWRWIKKNKWLDIGQPITEREFGIIIKTINNYLQEQLLQNKDINLPKRMGKIELRKYANKKEIVNNKLKTNLPINWKETLKLWYEDKDSYTSKTLIRYENTERFLIHYNKTNAVYTNKTFYKFIPTRTLRIKLNKLIKEGKIDALLLTKENELY